MIEPTHPLTEGKPDRASASAPEAAAWLIDPEPPHKPLTQAQRLAAEPQWEGPEEEEDTE